MGESASKPNDGSGKTIGDYELLAKLGKGGMGSVFKARHRKTGTVVAFKVLMPSDARNMNMVKRFLRESKIALDLKHENVVQGLDAGMVGNLLFLAMEFVDGESLGHLLKSRHFSEAEGIRIVRQVCKPLAVAHAEGLVHRDIKPDNLMLTSRGELKLVDLGIAKRIDDEQSLTLTGQSMGTPHYISPEQIRGQKDIDVRADIYSLGATFYHLVTGHTPFKGSSGAHVMSMHLVDALPDPRQWEPGLSEGLCRVLRKMMAKSREERYPDIAALDVDLHRLQAGQTPRPVEPSSTAVQVGTMPTVVTAAPPAAGPFDPLVLAKIEENLAASIGPMARLIVRKTAKTASSLETLCDELARQLAPGADREAFCAKCLACGKVPTDPGKGVAGTPPAGSTPARAGASRAVGQGAPGTFSPGAASGTAPWTDGDLVLLEAELARQIGPLARVLLKKAAKSSSTFADLVSRLEENIPGEEGRNAFRTALRRRMP